MKCDRQFIHTSIEDESNQEQRYGFLLSESRVSIDYRFVLTILPLVSHFPFLWNHVGNNRLHIDGINHFSFPFLLIESIYSLYPFLLKSIWSMVLFIPLYLYPLPVSLFSSIHSSWTLSLL